jgi:general secretion pathway protein K
VGDWRRRRLSRWSQLYDLRGAAPSIQQARPFLALEDLRDVPGVTPEIYDRASPFLTVFSATDRINPISASREVLLSLPGADQREIEAYIAARSASGPDLNLLPGLAGIAGSLGSNPVTYVTISSEGTTQTGARFVRMATVSLVAAGGQGFRFVSWQRGRGTDEQK